MTSTETSYSTTKFEPSNPSKFKRGTTWQEILKDKSLNGNTYIITGTNSGIGLATLTALSSKGANIIGLMRNISKMEEKLKKVLEENKTIKKEQFKFFKLDLSDLNSCRDASKEILSYLQNNKILVNAFISNAGVMFINPRKETKQGLEFHFGVNYFGPYYLFNLLSDYLFKQKNGRLVIVSSAAYKWGKMKWDDINLKEKYDKAFAYGMSSTARCIWARQFALQYQNSNKNNGWISLSLHPGVMVTELQDTFSLEDFMRFGMKNKDGTWNKENLDKMCSSTDQICGTTIYGVTSNDLNEKHSGAFLQYCGVARKWSGTSSDWDGYEGRLYDSNNCKKLYDFSQDFIKKFEKN